MTTSQHPSLPADATFPKSYRGSAEGRFSGVRLPDRAVVSVYLITVFLRLSNFHVLLGDFGFQLTLGIEILIYAYFALLAARRINYRAALLAAVYMIFLFAQVYNFHLGTGADLNFNAALQYISILSVLVFYETRASFNYIQTLIIGIATFYLLIYVLFYDQLLSIVPRDSSLYRPASAGRGERLNLAHGLATFALLVGLFSLRSSPAKAFMLVLVAGIAIVGAESRAFTGALIVGLLAMGVSSAIPALRSTVNWVLAAIFLCLAVSVVGPLVGFDYNPYSLMAGDSSGNARFLQYADGLQFLQGNIFLGAGIPTSSEDLQYFVNPARPFFPSDLGIFGIAFVFGLPFAILYSILTVALIVKPAANESGARMFPLFYTVQLQAFLGFFSAGLLNSSTTIFVGLAISAWLKTKRQANPTLHQPAYLPR